MRVSLEEAVEIVVGKAGTAPVLITCEHASERLPAPWEWPAADRWLVGTHWAYDIGASDLARELAERMGAVAVLSRFSRLLVDPNRPETSPELFRQVADGHPVELNGSIGAEERARRVERYYDAYHAAVDREVGARDAPVLLALHTFTPVYEGELRDVEVGILFDTDAELAERIRRALAETGLRVAMNEPYSGKAGFIYSVDRHARTHGRQAVELEVRQDLAVEAIVRARLVAALEAELG